MRIVLFQGLTPHVVEGPFTAVLVESDAGTPVSVTSEYRPGVFQSKHVDEQGFDATLRNLGLDRTTIVERRQGPTLAGMGI